MNRRIGRAKRAGLLVAAALTVLGVGGAGALPPVPFTVDANMANQATNDRELNIVVDPADGDHMAAGANMRGGPNGQRWYVSTDGGRTWTNGALPYGTIATGTNNTTNTLMSDPALDFDGEGDIYFSALAHGNSSDPCDLFVSASADDGANWSDPANGLVADGGASICNDKEFILVDRAQNDNVYVAWTPFGGGNDNELVFSRDTGGNDDGFAFSAPIVLSTAAAQNGCLNHGAELALQADGDLYVAWGTYCNGVGDGADSSIWVARSTDQGQNFGAPVQVATLDNVNPTPDPGFRARSFPSIAADPTTGRIFVVWADYTDADGGDADALIASSNDDGANWTAPAEVDVETDTDDQVMPWVTVAQNRVAVAFYSLDNTGTGPNNNWDSYLSYGTVAATPTFTQVRVSTVGTPVTTGFIGDYLGADSGPGDNKVHLAWGDGRAGVGGATDGFYGRVDFSPPQAVAGVAVPAALPWGQSTTITATVTGLNGEAEEHIPVSFSVSSAGTPSVTSGSGTSNASGQAAFSYSNGSPGVDTVTIWADLDENGTQDSGETTTVNVTWQKRPAVAAYTGPTSGEYHDPLTVSGTLADGIDASPLAGRTLTIGFGTDTCTGTTDGSGTATCGFTPQQVPGPYSASAGFAGDALYAPTTSPAVAFTLNKEQTTLIDLQPAFLANGLSNTVSAVLTEDDPTPVAGRAVTLTIGSGLGAQSCTDLATDATGKAECTILVNQPLGPSTLSASFTGDAYYLPSNASRSVIVFQWTTGGNFVVGDGNAATGGTATFWSSDWNKLNTVSGGEAPSAFKGFANLPSGPTTCGAPNWSSGGGNSPPPAGSVPAYTAFLVTSQVTKSGNIVSGTKPKIVIGNVNPGYAPSPGKSGTMVVVGTLCS
jgi:hypothetical protein